MRVWFPSAGHTLGGHLHRPDGAGRFPAVLWNHGSEPEPGSRDELGTFYTSAGYVLFVPHRRGHGDSPGAPLSEALGPQLLGGPRSRAIEVLIALHEQHLDETVAAMRWLGAQPFVDSDRIAISGVSHGGVQTLLAAESDVGARAYVPFAPAATGWDGNPELQDRLLAAVERAAAPIFLIQAANDHSLGPGEVLGSALARKGGLNQVRIYPPYGDSAQSGHGAFGCYGMGVWGPDVLGYLTEALATASAAPSA